ncbi:MAG TPA: pilus assembly protein PilM [Vicinamibacterales bacterium]|nr:pilus assembly protein PilM [Vicinamibacterales bacterium]
MSAPEYLRSAPPDVAIEIDAGHVAGARLTWRGDDAVVAAHSVAPLPPGLVAPSLGAPNLSDVPAVARAITAVLAQLGVKARRAALVIPDTVAKVSLVRFEKVPPQADDLLELVRWQIRKSAPFPLEQAVVSFTPGIKTDDGGQEFVVTVARTDVLMQYEEACTLAGVHAGLIDLASFSIINGVLAGKAAPAGDWLLVHATPTYMTLMVLRGGDLIFFRKAEESEGTLADVVHQTAMYYEDRLQGLGFTRVLLAGGAVIPGGPDALRRNLEERLGLTVESVDPRASAALLDHITASPDLLDALAPLVGILVRERKVA